MRPKECVDWWLWEYYWMHQLPAQKALDRLFDAINSGALKPTLQMRVPTK